MITTPPRIATRLHSFVPVTLLGVRYAIDSARRLTVKRVRRSRGRYAVRLMQGAQIVGEWTRPTEAEADAVHLAVMADLMEHDGFAGIESTSHDALTITGDMLATD